MRGVPIAALVCALLLPCAAAGAPYPWVPGNPADRLLSRPIEQPRYDEATRCRKRPTPGALALVDWLEHNFRGVSWGIVRCSRLGRHRYSVHAEGRAVDWHLDVHSRRDRAAARRLIGVLLAPDRAGNEHALARRMGVQGIIWNCRSWWSGAERMERYSVCYDRRGKRRKLSETLAHRDHVHLELNRAGARMKTSFWRR